MSDQQVKAGLLLYVFLLSPFLLLLFATLLGHLVQKRAAARNVHVDQLAIESRVMLIGAILFIVFLFVLNAYLGGPGDSSNVIRTSRSG